MYTGLQIMRNCSLFMTYVIINKVKHLLSWIEYVRFYNIQHMAQISRNWLSCFGRVRVIQFNYSSAVDWSEELSHILITHPTQSTRNTMCFTDSVKTVVTAQMLFNDDFFKYFRARSLDVIKYNLTNSGFSFSLNNIGDITEVTAFD